MGPKKEIAEKEKVRAIPSLEEPLNSEVWRCTVVMAIERSSCDSFILKEFMAEANNERRQEVKLINFDCFVIKILNDFVSEELSFKYVFLLNFSSIFHEAAEFVKSKLDIPVTLLVKVVKALLFLLREESIVKMEKKSMGPPDPVRTMVERPSNIGGVADNKIKSNAQKKEQTTAGKSKKGDAIGDNGIRIKPPSATKQETKLLKRGEGAKEDQCIDDAPLNGYFNLYILLTGFYHPDFPLELIKAGIPLHGLLCIDTSPSSGKLFMSSTHSRLQKRETSSEPIQNFWDSFLKILWDPKLNSYFKDIIFQVYTPQKLSCSKTKLKEFIYKELSYLMYDISDYKRQHSNYLSHMKLWNVNMKESDKVEESEEIISLIDNLPSECATVPVVIQYMLDVICCEAERHFYGPKSVSFDSIDMDTTEYTASKPNFSSSILAKYSSILVTPERSNTIIERGDYNALSVYKKTRELDVKYSIHDRNYWFDTSSGNIPLEKIGSETLVCCPKRKRVFAENLEEALNPEWGLFKSLWKNIAEQNKSFCLDYRIYSLLMTKVFCSYQVRTPVPTSFEGSFPSNSYSKKKLSFEIIEKVEQEMRNSHFTVTNSSRNVLKYIPYNVKEINRDFFCPPMLKIVTPGTLKAVSVPEFRKPPLLENEISFLSDFIIPEEVLQNLEFNVFENIEGFLREDLLSAVNGFDFVEELSKPKLLMKECDFRDDYNCTDHFYSALADSIFVILHNRKDSDNTSHETFNETIRTAIGLRDFFEYILEDESLWLETQEKLHQSKLSHIGNNSEGNSDLKNYSDSDFWMETSIKYQDCLKLGHSPQNEVKESKELCVADNEKESKEPRKAGFPVKSVKKDTSVNSNEFVSLSESEHTFTKPRESYAFEGYNISDVAVQYSGLKTVYHTNDCSIAVELIERLYGNQDLGIHIRQGNHSLHLYSYVCPEPHLLDPYTFHLSYKNGIVIAFGKRFVETFDVIEEEVVESKTVLTKVKRNSSELSTAKKTKRLKKVPKSVEDDKFSYDMRLSIPNGLAIAVVRKITEPCYIKQWYLGKSYSNSEKTLGESKRLFLPNGNVVKVMKDGTVEILRADTSIVRSSLVHLTEMVPTYKSPENTGGIETDSVLTFIKYEITTSEGFVYVVDEGKVISSKRLEVFVNRNAESNTTFYRRVDGTNYIMQNDGTLCVQFKDGTKISNSILFKQKENLSHSVSQEEEVEEKVAEKTDTESEFTFIYNEVIMEHPDYATVIYNSQTQEWKILLPFDSTIKVEPEGKYQVIIDTQTELMIDRNAICMNRFSIEHKLQCQTIANLTVFENGEKKIYCQMKDTSGKTFVVEPNSNCYILSPEEIQESAKEFEGNIRHESKGLSSQSEFVALDGLPSCASTETTREENKRRKLSPENKYFVIRRDLTGFELLHTGDVIKALEEIKKGSIIFTQEIPGSGKLRCFVLIRPAPKVKSKHRKWEVESILPETKFVLNDCKAMTSSLYGLPVSWMHPFPKKKKKFEIPQELTCRVFIETKRSEICPQLGSLDSYYSEIEDLLEIKHSNIQPGLRNILIYMKRLSNDDQDILKEMYALAAGQILSMKKKLKPVNTKKLEHYLALRNYFWELQEYHKNSIRYHNVPNYFDHPAGICWLLLNDLKLTEHEDQNQPTTSIPPSPLSASMSIFSNEEIEYNLTVNATQSYSDLSCRTDITMLTAPTIMDRKDLCTCKIKPTRGTVSAPIFKIHDSIFSEYDVKVDHRGVCGFEEDEIKSLEKTNDDRREGVALKMTLEDLISLGLV